MAMTGIEDGRPAGGKPFTGRMALALFVAFFGVIFAVNGAMLTMALKTHSGVVSNEPYRKGLKYNERIAADERQAALGWSSGIELSPDARKLVVTLADRDGKALDGMAVSAVLGRPSTTRDDLKLDLVPQGPGRYEVPLPVLAEGGDIAALDVASGRGSGAEIVYRARRRLWVKR